MGPRRKPPRVSEMHAWNTLTGDSLWIRPHCCRFLVTLGPSRDMPDFCHAVKISSRTQYPDLPPKLSFHTMNASTKAWKKNNKTKKDEAMNFAPLPPH